jgi:(p)ppGpp synthase/HD superfamily hydrolase
MKLTPLIQKAITESARLHKDQKRKVDGSPYVTHAFSVAWILEDYTDDEKTLATALLHDVLEDVPDYSMEQLVKDFGSEVAAIVREVSVIETRDKGNNRKLSWKKRKEQYLAQINNASEGALLVSAADKIHNLQSLVTDHEREGDGVWDNFNSTAAECVWFNEQVLKVLEERLDNPIVALLKDVLSRIKEIVPD